MTHTIVILLLWLNGNTLPVVDSGYKDQKACLDAAHYKIRSMQNAYAFTCIKVVNLDS